MKRHSLVPVVLTLSIVCACTQSVPLEAHSEHKPDPAPALSFVERLSAGANERETLPLIVAIHGLGDSPENFVELFEDFDVKARIVAPRAPDPWGEGTSWYSVDDPAQEAPVIRKRAKLISTLIGQLTRKHRTKGKAVVTGFSQGGVLSFAMAALYPLELHTALPIAGFLPSELYPSATPSFMPSVIAFHGTADRRIPYADGESSVRALKTRGYDATLKSYDGVGHGIPQAMRDELYAALRAALARNTSH